MNSPVVWFEIYVQDSARAKAFYEKVLGVAFSKIENSELEMWAFPTLDGKEGARGALVKMAGVPSGGNSVLVYFGAEDCGATAETAARSGGRIFKPKMSVGEYGYIALVHDTEGNMIGLHSMT